MTNLNKQKILAGKVAGVGKDKIKIDSSMAEEIKEAITKEDIRSLIAEGAIEVVKDVGISRHRARKRHIQRKKGRQRGQGKREGKVCARYPSKLKWMNKIRSIRVVLKELKTTGKVTLANYRDLYRKAKGGFFRDRGHLEIYLKQNKMVKK